MDKDTILKFLILAQESENFFISFTPILMLLVGLALFFRWTVKIARKANEENARSLEENKEMLKEIATQLKRVADSQEGENSQRKG